MQPDIRIRQAHTDDIEDVAHLLLAAFASYRPRYTEQAFAATTPHSEGIARRMQEGPIWLAFQDDTPVGTAAAVYHSEECYLRGMGVLPGWRSRGAGYILLTTVEQFAAKNG